MRKLLDALSPDERKVLKDASTIRRVLTDPILKLLVMRQPQKVMDLQVENLKSQNIALVPTDRNIDLFINEFTHKIIKEYKSEIVKIKKKNLITFKIEKAVNYT